MSWQYYYCFYLEMELDVWNKMIELNKPDNLNNAACKPLRDAVIAEKGCSTNVGCAGQCVPGSHCIRRIPATDSNHSKGTAFDIPQSTIQELLSELTPLPPAPMLLQQKLLAQRIWISNWLSNPPACNLYWGGNFNNPPDFVHFQLP